MASARPTHITLPDAHTACDVYHTAPSSPSSPFDVFYTPPSSPPSLHITIDDPFPSSDLTLDLALDDAGLSPLEKIYLFASSNATFHRIFIAHTLPDLLQHVAPQDATQYVLPLLESLAQDEDEQVKESLSLQLVPVIWWFFTHCDVSSHSEISNSPSTVLIQAFTPILGTLLLSPNPLVGAATRRAIVDLLLRLRDADKRDAACIHLSEKQSLNLGSFDHSKRQLLRTELLHQVVVGMAHLDLDPEDLPTHQDVVMREIHQPTPTSSSLVPTDVKSKSDFINPYFPVLPPLFAPSLSSPSSSSTGSAPPKPPSSSSTGTTTTTKKEQSPEPYRIQSNSVRRQDQLDFARSLSPARHPPLRPVPGGVSIPLSPTQETLSAIPELATPPTVDQRQPSLAEVGFHTPYDILQDIQTTFGSDDGEDDEQAAVGRLSSMSLMAAVTASGTLEEESKEAFVNEVVRVAQDSVYWVRREASFALGALAKVVPEDIVVGSLLPLFNTLREDSSWHVRHSALFALPAILSRLSASHRRSLAVETIMALATDESSAVQCGVLEALGEVLYTFFQAEGGPPEELVNLFLGRREDRRLRDGQQGVELLPNSVERPLICAFNYPAVALTLGRERWGELRGLYKELSENRTIKVRRSLAASVGELAKIVGTENAERDLVGVWWDGIRCEDEEVRTRAMESLPLLMKVVGTKVGDNLVAGLLTVWDEGGFQSWRERVEFAQGLVDVAPNAGPEGQRAVVGLVRRALEDNVTAVREAGVHAVAGIWTRLDAEVVELLRADIGRLAQSPVFKRRMIFIACQHALIPIITLDNAFFDALLPLTSDPVDAVRIRLARLLASISSIPPSHLQITARLSQDPCADVKAYINNTAPIKPTDSFSTFSRPPPTNNASKDRPVTLLSLPSSALPNLDQLPVPVDISVSHDHPQSGRSISAAITNSDIDTKSISPVPA